MVERGGKAKAKAPRGLHDEVIGAAEAWGQGRKSVLISQLASRGWTLVGEIAFWPDQSEMPCVALVRVEDREAAIEQAWEAAGLPELGLAWQELCADPSAGLRDALSDLSLQVTMSIFGARSSKKSRDMRASGIEAYAADVAKVADLVRERCTREPMNPNLGTLAKGMLAPMLDSPLSQHWKGAGATRSALAKLDKGLSARGQRKAMMREAGLEGLWESGRPLASAELLAAMEEADPQWAWAMPDLHFKARWGGVWEYVEREQLGGPDTAPWRAFASSAIRCWPKEAAVVLAAREASRIHGGVGGGPKPWAPPSGSGRYLHANSVSDALELRRDLEQGGLLPAHAVRGVMEEAGPVSLRREAELSLLGWGSLSWEELLLARELVPGSYAVFAWSIEHVRGLARARGSKGARLSMEIFRQERPGENTDDFALALAEEVSGGGLAGWGSRSVQGRARRMAQVLSDLRGEPRQVRFGGLIRGGSSYR